MVQWDDTLHTTQVVPGRAGGGRFSRKKFQTKERICLLTARKATNQCDAQTEFFVRTSLQPFHGGDVPWW